MTIVVSRPRSDRLALGCISILIACAAACQSDLADPQSGSSSTAGTGGGKATSDRQDEQGGADGVTTSTDRGGDGATSDTHVPNGGAGENPASGGTSAAEGERGGTSTGRGGAPSSTSTPGGGEKGGASSTAQGGAATGGRAPRTSATGGRTQFGSTSGGRAAGGQATGGKSSSVATGGKAQGGSASGGSNTGGANTGGANTTPASTAPSSEAQEYVDATNEVRAAVTAPANYSGTWVPLPNVTWSEEVAASAQQWANHLRDAENCGLVHEQKTGLGENLAMGTRLTPTDAVKMWASEKSKFTYTSPFSYTAAAGHYTQLVWRTSVEIGCGSATCGNAVVISCRYKPPGNVIGGKIY